MNLANYPASDLIKIIVALTLCILTLIAGLVFALAKLRVRKVGSSGVEMGYEEAPEVSAPSPHKTCGNGKDWVLILTEHEEMLYNVYRKEFRIQDKQLSFAEAKLSILQGKAQSLFLKLLKKRIGSLPSDYVTHLDFERYVHSLERLAIALVPILKADFDMDEYEAQSEEQFRMYVDLHTSQVIQLITNYLNDNYSGTEICRADLYDENRMSLMSEAENTIGEIYWNARKILLETKEETSALRQAFKEKVSKII